MAYDPQNSFAKILRGELPCIRIDENADALAFMDIMPQADGHVLIVPKEPAETLFELTEEKASACIKMTRRVAIAVKAALGSEGILIAQVNGAAAGQTVPHVHFHVIREDPAKLQRIADLIRASLKATG
jgi:histidine triad (HIT) family protein